MLKVFIEKQSSQYGDTEARHVLGLNRRSCEPVLTAQDLFVTRLVLAALATTGSVHPRMLCLQYINESVEIPILCTEYINKRVLWTGLAD